MKIEYKKIQAERAVLFNAAMHALVAEGLCMNCALQEIQKKYDPTLQEWLVILYSWGFNDGMLGDPITEFNCHETAEDPQVDPQLN